MTLVLNMFPDTHTRGHYEHTHALTCLHLYRG